MTLVTGVGSGMAFCVNSVAYHSLGWFTKWVTGAVAPSLLSYVWPVVAVGLVLRIGKHFGDGWKLISIPKVTNARTNNISNTLKALQDCIAQQSLANRINRLYEVNTVLLKQLQSMQQEYQKSKSVVKDILCEIFSEKICRYLPFKPDNKALCDSIEYTAARIKRNDGEIDKLLKEFVDNTDIDKTALRLYSLVCRMQ